MLHVQYDGTIFGRTTISYDLRSSWKKYENQVWAPPVESYDDVIIITNVLPTSTKNKSEHVRELWWHHHPIRFDDVGLLYSRTSPDMSKSRLVIGRELWWWHQHQRFADVGLFDSRPDMYKSRLLIGREFVSKTWLLYTSDAADERSSVDLGGSRNHKKKHNATKKDRRNNDQ